MWAKNEEAYVIRHTPTRPVDTGLDQINYNTPNHLARMQLIQSILGVRCDIWESEPQRLVTRIGPSASLPRRRINEAMARFFTWWRVYGEGQRAITWNRGSDRISIVRDKCAICGRAWGGHWPAGRQCRFQATYYTEAATMPEFRDHPVQGHARHVLAIRRLLGTTQFTESEVDHGDATCFFLRSVAAHDATRSWEHLVSTHPGLADVVDYRESEREFRVMRPRCTHCGEKFSTHAIPTQRCLTGATTYTEPP